jgi:SRSO17 transposase
MGTVHRGRHGWHHLAAMEMAGFFFIVTIAYQP